MRLDKFFSTVGLLSRKQCLIELKRCNITVDGEIVKKPDTKIDPEKNVITYKGETVNYKQYVYIMLNKPRGYVTTVSDELGRKTVMDLLPNFGCRIYPVGRLDKDSEGLLLLTNDGSFTNCMTHPSHEYAKVYRVTVRPAVNDEILFNLRNGIEIDGRKTAPCEVTVLTEEENRVVLEFILHEGRNRQIRKMCESQGLEVARLKRISIGPIKLGMLKQGDYRELSEQDVKKLLRSAGHKEN